mmetsp:Transcript_14213/g.23184  ORF Transcript_14213/g.23184 Transcript_14213/m.23184 type:complete len:381 (+) Transcript_14213:137-1279(+)
MGSASSEPEKKKKATRGVKADQNSGNKASHAANKNINVKVYPSTTPTPTPAHTLKPSQNIAIRSKHPTVDENYFPPPLPDVVSSGDEGQDDEGKRPKSKFGELPGDDAGLETPLSKAAKQARLSPPHQKPSPKSDYEASVSSALSSFLGTPSPQRTPTNGEKESKALAKTEGGGDVRIDKGKASKAAKFFTARNAKTLRNLSVEDSVKLPTGALKSAWIASNLKNFQIDLKEIWGLVESVCRSSDEETCLIMSAGSRYQFLWQDGEKYKKPTELRASDYIDTLFAHAERKFDQWKIAEDATSPLPKGSLREAKMIYKRLFRVYAHLFHSHFELIKNTDTEGPLTVCFKRFVLFIKEFNLVKENELAPMKELIALIVEKKI